METIEEAAELYKVRIGLGLKGAMVLAVPVPERYSVELEEPIAQAVEGAKCQGIAGSALTPWLLKRIYDMAGEKVVKANIELLKNNASKAADLASALAADSKDRKIGFH